MALVAALLGAASLWGVFFVQDWLAHPEDHSPEHRQAFAWLAAALLGTLAALVFQLARLKRSTRELRRLKVELEQRVEERTAQLTEANRILSATQKRNEALFNAIPDIILRFDREGTILDVRAGLKSQLSVSNMVGKNVTDLPIVEAHKHLFRTAFDHAQATGEAVTYDYDILVNGELRHREARMAACGRNEVLGIVRDFTESRRAAAELAEAKKAAEGANRAKSTFLANMSHELRTPMNAIIGYSEMILEDADDLEKEDILPDLEKIRAAGRHLLALINDVLDLSKIEAGKMELYLEDFDLGTMLDEVAATAASLAERQSNVLRIERGEGLGMIHADATKVRQVLLNLLSNACKFTEEGTITLEALREGDRIVFRVSDTGIGMSPEQLGRIWNEFAQADATTTRKYGGTGLGLTISRYFCRMMRGDVGVESEPGRGTTFTVTLPAEVAERGTGEFRALTATAEIPVQGGAPRTPVVVIDDDRSTIDLIQRFLSREGFGVWTAASGAEGLQLVRSIRPAAVVLDLRMPGLDGWTVLTTLKRDPSLAGIPVIILSIEDDRGTGLALGAAEYLTKPLDREALLAALRRQGVGRPAGSAAPPEESLHA